METPQVSEPFQPAEEPAASDEQVAPHGPVFTFEPSNDDVPLDPGEVPAPAAPHTSVGPSASAEPQAPVEPHASMQPQAVEGVANLTIKGSIAGRVINAAGNSVAGVTVTIEQGPQPHNDIAAFTNAEGRFRLNSLAPGPYILSAHHGGQVVGGAHAEVPPGQQAEVEIRLNG